MGTGEAQGEQMDAATRRIGGGEGDLLEKSPWEVKIRNLVLLRSGKRESPDAGVELGITGQVWGGQEGSAACVRGQSLLRHPGDQGLTPELW